MRWVTLSSFLLLQLILCAKADWSWNGDSSSKTNDNETEKPELLQGEQAQEASDKTSDSNGTVLDDIVDELITSKQGRSLGGFDDVYNDPSIKDALDSGDDIEARSLIKERLCTLGLMQCDDDEDLQEKKTYLSPDDLIYAQPVDIKPVGKPIASIPIRGPPRAYGSPKPVPYPSRPSKYPPKRVGYVSNSRPGFADKYSQVQPENYQYNQHNGLNNNYNGFNKPLNTNSPYAFENNKPSYNKVPATQNGVKPDTIVQQHVHHHYVHDDSNKDPKVIIKPVAIPVGSVGSLSQSYTPPSVDVITAGNLDYNDGFKPLSDIYSENRPTDTIYGNQYNKVPGYSAQQSLPYPNDGYDGNKYGNSLGSYGNSDFYKKEFNVGSSNTLYNQGPSTFDQSQNYHEAKAQGFECICVNYDQCPSQEIIGRREDLYLAIDPRNKGSDIAALTDEQTENITETVVKTGLSDEEIDKIIGGDGSKTKEDDVQEDTKEIKKISKREVKEDVEEQAEEKSASEIEPRLIGLTGYGGNGGFDHRKIQPTFGVSFGLPKPDAGTRPFNPYENPYGPVLNNGGLNFGLVSVNPLLSVQLTKNEYGDKVVKPFVNLHFTPNENIIHKLGYLFNEKKMEILNQHDHHHHYHHKPYRPYYGPHNHYYSRPPSYYPSSYYQTYPYKSTHNYEIHEDDIDEHFEDKEQSHSYDDDYYSNYVHSFDSFNYGRSADQNNYADRYSYSRSFSDLPLSQGAEGDSKTVRFPSNRRKRDLNIEKSINSIEERNGYYGGPPRGQQCRNHEVCCRRPLKPQAFNKGQCGIRHSQGINGRIKTPGHVDGDSEFGEYPWQAAILKKDPKESVYVCGGTLIDQLHIMTAAHCVKSYNGHELRVRLGEWDVNHDVEFYPYIERDVISVHVNPQYYAGTLDNDLAILKLEHPVEWTKFPHISPACLPDKYTDYAGQRCWTTGWGKDAFGDYGKYQNILKEVDVPILSHGQCQSQLRKTRLGYNYELNPGFLCAGGEDGKDACKGDGGGPLVCEHGGTWQIVGVVSWGIGCGQPGVPGVYVKVAHYLDWISQVTGKFSNY